MDNKVIILFEERELHQQENLKYFQCDCACSNNYIPCDLPPILPESILTWAEVYQQRLDEDFELFYNPQFDSGVAVLNSAAVECCGRYPRSFRLADLPDEDQPVIQQLFKAGLVQILGRDQPAVSDRSDTLIAWLSVTNQCNLACSYCYITQKSQIMSEETGKKIIEKLIKTCHLDGYKAIRLKYAGGEPTLYMDRIFKLNAYGEERCRQEGLRLHSAILTNGVSISDAEIRQIAANNIEVMLSLDGLGFWNDKHRVDHVGRSVFGKSLHTLERMQDAGIQPMISITITPQNMEGLPDLVRFLLKRKLRFNFNFLRPLGEEGLSITTEDACLLTQKISQAMDEIETNLPEKSLLGFLLDRAQLLYKHGRTCSAGYNYMVFDPLGQVSSCHMLLGEKEISSDLSNELFGTSVDEKEGCQSCIWRYSCAGGCPLLTYRTYGRVDTHSPYCEVYKELFPKLLRLEALRLIKQQAYKSRLVQ